MTNPQDRYLIRDGQITIDFYTSEAAINALERIQAGVVSALSAFGFESDAIATNCEISVSNDHYPAERGYAAGRFANATMTIRFDGTVPTPEAD